MSPVCNVCESEKSLVINSRKVKAARGFVIRRRRLCECGERYTTYETSGSRWIPVSIRPKKGKWIAAKLKNVTVFATVWNGEVGDSFLIGANGNPFTEWTELPPIE